MALSATEAALEGFRLIGRRPVSVLTWALAWTVLAYGPLAWLLYVEGSSLAQSMAQAFNGFGVERGDMPAMFARMLHLEMDIYRVMGPWILWVWLLHVVFRAAVYRAVLEPEKRSFAYLRLSGDELRLFLLQVIYVILVVAGLGVLIAAGVAVFSADGRLQQPVQGLLDGLAVVALLVLCVYVGLRLSLAASMTFAEKRLRIFDSWGLTGRHVLQMLGVVVLAVVFVGVVAFVGAVIRNAVVYGAVGDIAGDMVRVMPTAASPRFSFDARFFADLQRLAGPAIIAAVAVQVLLETAMRVLWTAPFAAAYRDLAH
jgi:hypothetical protein